MKEDLDTEYRRWKNKQKQLLAMRDSLTAKIASHKAALLTQQSLQSLAVRLQGDLRLATEETAKLNETRDEERDARRRKQAKLKRNIQHLQDDIDAVELKAVLTVNATQDRIDKVLEHQLDVQAEIMNTTKNISDVQHERAKQRLAAAHEHGKILAEIGDVREQTDEIQKRLEAQAVVLTERERLANQARKVVGDREMLERWRLHCAGKLQQLDAEVLATRRAMAEDTEELRQCQALDAQNQKLKDTVNQCRAKAAR